MKRILIATDGSAAAHEAVELGVELARDEGAEAIFVHAVPTHYLVSMNGFGLMGSPAAAAGPLEGDLQGGSAPRLPRKSSRRAPGCQRHTQLPLLR